MSAPAASWFRRITLDHHDTVLRPLFGAGFGAASSADVAAEMLDAHPERDFPNLSRFMAEGVAGGEYDLATEFPIGLELVLDVTGMTAYRRCARDRWGKVRVPG